MKIRILKPNQVTENYVKWFEDKDVTKYSDNQYRAFSLEGQKSYIEECLNDNDTRLYGIFEEERHIGNIVLRDINSIHKKAELTYFIGEKIFWGKGIAKRAISLIIEIARNELKLNKLYAGTAINNIASQKVLERNNFVLEGIRTNHLFYNNRYEDQLDYGLLLKENKSFKKELITLSEGLDSNHFEINDFIIKPPSQKHKKTTSSLLKEFNICKYQHLMELIRSDYRIKLIDIERIVEGDSKTYAFYNENHYFVKSDWLREETIHDISDSLIDLFKTIKFDYIIELGAGYGSKILSIASSNVLPEKIQYEAIDISKNGLYCCRELAKRLNIKIKTKEQDFRETTRIITSDKYKSVVFTSYNLHYWKKFTVEDIKNFIADGIMGGVHIEPLSDKLSTIEDKLYASLSMKYMIYNNYTVDIGKAFYQAKKEGLIDFKLVNGIKGNGLLPAWNIIWNVKPQ